MKKKEKKRLKKALISSIENEIDNAGRTRTTPNFSGIAEAIRVLNEL